MTTMNSGGYWYGNTSATTANITVWPLTAGGPLLIPQLPSVVDERYNRKFAEDRGLTAREWLDAQVDDVCALAAI